MSYWTVSNAFLSYPVSLIAKCVRINESSYLASSDNTAGTGSYSCLYPSHSADCPLTNGSERVNHLVH